MFLLKKSYFLFFSLYITLKSGYNNYIMGSDLSTIAKDIESRSIELSNQATAVAKDLDHEFDRMGQDLNLLRMRLKSKLTGDLLNEEKNRLNAIITLVNDIIDKDDPIRVVIQFSDHSNIRREFNVGVTVYIDLDRNLYTNQKLTLKKCASVLQKGSVLVSISKYKLILNYPYSYVPPVSLVKSLPETP